MSEILEPELTVVKTQQNNEKANVVNSSHTEQLNIPDADLDLDNIKSKFGRGKYKRQEERVIESINKSSLGPGLILKTMREDAKLSKDDIAKELRLAVRHVEYLENDQYDKFSALVFYLGNIRNYSHILELDPDKMIAKFYAVYDIPRDTFNINPKQVSLWQEQWPFCLFFSSIRTIEEKARHTKSLVLGLIFTVVFILVWFLMSTLGKSGIDEKNSLVKSNVDVEKIQPEKVDELLPTSPVIVKKDQPGNIKTAASKSSSKKYPKQNKIDDYS